MIVRGSQALIACPKAMYEEIGGGTWSTIRFAKSQGKHVYVVWPDGTVEEHKEI